MKSCLPGGLVLWCVIAGTSPGAAGPGPAVPPAGYVAKRLPLPPDVLPSCMTVRDDGTLVVGSMDGDIALVSDSDGDGTLDRYTRRAGTLPQWPLGLRAEGDDLLVAARGALLRLEGRDRDGRAERWSVVSDAWDVSRDHHDWTTGIARLPDGGWEVCPVTDDVRTKDITGRHHFRGKALRVAPDGSSRVLAEGLRYPTGWATRRKDDAVFFTDNQGQQKTTCEVDRLVPGGWYGYASQADPPSNFTPPADPSAATDPRHYRLRRYHHVFQGAYHSPPTAEQELQIESAALEPDGPTVRLTVGEAMIPDRIYELRTNLADAHPAVAHDTMNRVPRPAVEPGPSPVS